VFEIYKQNKNIFKEIVSLSNLEKAYLDIVEKFEKESKSFRYRGCDGTRLNEIDSNSKKIIKEIRKELLEFKTLQPAYKTLIPKKNGKKRGVYVYSVKDRIKAEAIYRVLIPLFDEYFSPFLFSYRSSHPSHYAARSAVRRYKRYYGENFVLVADISSYSETINHNILIEKLKKVGLDTETIKLLKLFIKTKVLEDGEIVNREAGFLTGTPLYALLSNFYMDEFDKVAGKYVSFYRRVGDDVIAMDKSKEKIEKLQNTLLETTKKLKIKLNNEKGSLVKDTEEFKFLGYRFKNKKISFDNSSKNKIISAWKSSMIPNKKIKESDKKKKIKKILYSKNENIKNQFKQIIHQKKLVDDHEQIKEISDEFFNIVTKYLKNSRIPKSRRLSKENIKNLKIKSLYNYYKEINKYE